MLEKITEIAAAARGTVLQFKQCLEASTDTQITLSATANSGRLPVRIVGSRQDSFDEAEDRIQRIALSLIPWEKRRVSPESAATIMNLFQCNLPDFKGFYRGFRAPDLGQVRAGAQGCDDKSEIALDGTLLPLLYEIDKEEQKIVAANSAGHDYDARRYVNVCAAALEYFFREFEEAPLPHQDAVMLFRNVSTSLTHAQIRAKFSGRVKDIVHDRRGDGDLSIGGKIYVVFETIEDANCVPRESRESPTSSSQFNDARSRRLQVLHCIVNGVPLSGRGLRKAARISLRQRIRKLHATSETPAEAGSGTGDETELVEVPDEQIDPVGEDFVHVGLVREDEVVDDEGNWMHVEVDAPAMQQFHLPNAVRIAHRGAAWQLRNALRSRYVPHHFVRPRRDGKKPRHTIFEDLRVTESAFFHILDALWKIEGFREQMEPIIKENDSKFRRKNWERLQSAHRPPSYHNPFRRVFDRDGNETLTVPHRYQRLVTVADAEGLRQATAILRALEANDITAIDTEGGNQHGRPETIQVASKHHSILVDVRMCTEQAPVSLLNDFLYWLFANPSKKFGMAFDGADRCAIAATVGPGANQQAVKRLVTRAKVDDIRQLVVDTFAYNENGRYIGLSEYVMERPRLSHFVHAVLGKRLNKAYTCSMWASRPLFEEQLTYAHLDCICIVLMVERCLEKPRGQQVLDEMTRRSTSEGWRHDADDEDACDSDYDDYPFVTCTNDMYKATPTSSSVADQFAAQAAAMPRFAGMDQLNVKNRARIWNRMLAKPSSGDVHDPWAQWYAKHAL